MKKLMIAVAIVCTMFTFGSHEKMPIIKQKIMLILQIMT